MSEFADFKTYIFLYVQNNLHKIAYDPQTGRGGGEQALTECQAQNSNFSLPAP